jgi:hypothetical protein
VHRGRFIVEQYFNLTRGSWTNRPLTLWPRSALRRSPGSAQEILDLAAKRIRLLSGRAHSFASLHRRGRRSATAGAWRLGLFRAFEDLPEDPQQGHEQRDEAADDVADVGQHYLMKPEAHGYFLAGTLAVAIAPLILVSACTFCSL